MVDPPINHGRVRSLGMGKILHSLVDDELIESVGWLIGLRWLAGSGVLLVTLGIGPVLGLSVARLPLLVIGALILVYNLVFFVIDHQLRRSTALAYSYRKLTVWQVTLDWLAMTLLIYFSGGIESPAVFFFLFHIVIASMFFTPRLAFSFSFLAIGLISAIALLEYSAAIPHQSVGGFLEYSLHDNPFYIAAILGFFGSTGLIVAYLATTISSRLQRREQEVVQLTIGLQRATARLQALNEGARTITSTLELSQVLNRFVQNAAEVMEVRACSIRLLDKTGKRLEPVATYGLSQAYLDKGPIELESNPLAREVLNGKIVNISDVSQSDLLQYPEWAAQEGICSMLSAPLAGKSKAIGILRAYSDEKSHFIAEDVTFLTAIAAQGSIAIENALAYQAIESLDANKSTFIRMITHELRSPVSVTRSLLRTITAGFAGNVNPQQVDILERASRRLDFLQKLIDDLLDLAAGKVEILKDETSPLALDEVILRVVNRYLLPAQEKRINLLWDNQITQGVVTVLANADGLDRVFNNLISNAVKYTQSNGVVTVSLASCNNNAQIVIKDTGIGIPEDALEHLFEEFFRAPNAKAMEREGTGLGLTIARDTIVRFGGSLNVQSKEGQGTIFTIELPLYASPAGE